MEVLYKEITPEHFNKEKNFKQNFLNWFKDKYNLTFLAGVSPRFIILIPSQDSK